MPRGQQGFNPGHEAQQERDQQQAGLEIAPQRGGDERDEDEDQPAHDP